MPVRKPSQNPPTLGLQLHAQAASRSFSMEVRMRCVSSAIRVNTGVTANNSKTCYYSSTFSLMTTTLQVRVHRCSSCMVNFLPFTNIRLDALEGGSEICLHNAPRWALVVELYVSPCWRWYTTMQKQEEDSSSSV